MTRRQRMERIIEGFGPDNTRYHLAALLAASPDRLSLFTDEAVEQLASRLVEGRRQQARFAEHNRRTGRA